jgi:hypothetical protein
MKLNIQLWLAKDKSGYRGIPCFSQSWSGQVCRLHYLEHEVKWV